MFYNTVALNGRTYTDLSLDQMEAIKVRAKEIDIDFRMPYGSSYWNHCVLNYTWGPDSLNISPITGLFIAPEDFWYNLQNILFGELNDQNLDSGD